MDQNYMANHIVCTMEEKRFCLKTADKLLQLSQKGRCCGLLELERMILSAEYQEPPLLSVAFALVIDGTDPKCIEEIMDHYIITSDFSNRDYLDNYLVKVGALAIQQGENPTCIQEKLCSLFGISFREEFYQYLMPKEEGKEKEALPELCSIKLESFPKIDLLDFLQNGVDEKSMQRLIFEIPSSVLETALIGCQEKIIRKFLRNMSERRQQDFFAFVNTKKCVTKEEIEMAQNEAANVFHKLERSGEIIGLRKYENRMLTQEEVNQCFIHKPNLE